MLAVLVLINRVGAAVGRREIALGRNEQTKTLSPPPPRTRPTSRVRSSKEHLFGEQKGQIGARFWALAGAKVEPAASLQLQPSRWLAFLPLFGSRSLFWLGAMQRPREDCTGAG